MVKKVVNNSQVVHLWANQSQSDARSNNRSFDGVNLYSYRTRVGCLHDVAGRRVALLTCRTYSVTTSAMMSETRRAVSHLTSFDVPDVMGWDHAGNLHYLVSEYTNHVASMLRKRGEPTYDYSILGREWSRIGDYARAFGLAVPEIDHSANVQRIQDHFSDPVRLAKRAARDLKTAAKREAAERAYAERRRTDRLEAAEKIVLWRAGSISTHQLPWAARSLDDGSAMVRVVGDVLETSQGASVPLCHAIRVFRRVAACKASGMDWHRNGDTIRVGQFQVDAINADGSFRAGCHTFAWSEIEALASSIGVLSEIVG